MNAPRKLDDALGQALRSGRAPEDLRQRLLEEAKRRDAGRPLLRPWLMMAAALFFGVSGALVVYRGIRPSPVPVAAAALPELLEAASLNYRTVTSLDFAGRDCTDKACGLWALRRLGFTAPLPACLPESAMAGGRSCAVQGRPVAHYTFRDGRALYVFQAPLEGCGTVPGVARPVEGQLMARAWNEQGRGYVLLEPR